MSEKPMKLTCVGNGTKKNAYIVPSMYLHSLRESVVIYLLGNGEAVKRDFRVYWIDQDNDEIDIVNQSDYEIFMKANKERMHLYAVAKSENGSNGTQQKDSENGSNGTQQTGSTSSTNGMFPTTASHTHVECDGCKMKPIVGFRYKCIECQNFDLCQACEAKHVHQQHMMVRMPNGDCPNLVEAWVTGRSKRPSKRASRGACPFVVSVPTAAPETTAAPGGGDSERHHRRSHRRREINNGVFGNLYKMMVDLAEGGVQVNEETVASGAAGAATAAGVAANAAKVAAEACATAAASASATNTETENKATKKEETSTGAVPKTPPSTPGGNAQQPNSVPSTPTLENLAQFIDPQYMRTGIEILNNFSEMFAKMLDPNDGADMSCPFANLSNNETRKNSAASNDSTKPMDSTSTTSTTNQAEQTNDSNEAAIEKQSENEVPTSTVESPLTAASAPTISKEQTPERSHSQSFEDNDWQLIDQQPSVPEMTSVSPKPAQSIDFAQLSKDLKAHIEEEQKRQAETQLQPQAAVAATQTNVATTVSTSTTTSTTDAPIVEPVQQTTPQPIPQPRTNEEKRAVPIFHADPRINNAAHAMMAMGFSNEGGWLTQLLESVNGSIPDALDLMNAAQRNNN